MFRKRKLDSLLLFLLLAITTLLCSVDDKPALFGFLPKYVYDIDIEHQLKVDSTENGISEISVFNPSLVLEYSVDGGDTWMQTNSNLELSEIKMKDLLSKSTSPRWLPNDGNFFEVKSLRVRVLDEIGRKISYDKVVTLLPQEFQNIPVVSLNLRESDLFDWQNGLLLQGISSQEQKPYLQEWWYKPGNYQERGFDWERAVNFQYFVNGDLKVDQDCGIRINGNATRAFPQKSFRVLASKIYGNTSFNYSFWGNDNNQPSSIVLRNSGNDNTRTMFADLLVHRLFKDTEILVQDGFPVNVYINGNYWGIFNLRERVDEFYISQKRSWKATDISILEEAGANLKAGSELEKKRFDAMISGLPQNVPLTNDQFQKVSDEIELESFIDYIIAETFIANCDWPNNNSTWYCKNGKRWKWLLNDTDYSLAYPGEENVNTNLFDMLSTDQSCTAKLFNALISNSEFKAKFKVRALEILQNQLSEAQINLTFEGLKKLYLQDIEKTIRRWRTINSVTEWHHQCDANKKFLIERRSIYLIQIQAL